MRKKFPVFLLLSPLLMSCGGNASSGSFSQSEEDISSETSMESSSEATYQYTRKEMYQRIWNSKVIYNETCVMTEGDDGRFSCQLLYNPTKIICIKDNTLQNTYNPSEYYLEDGRIYMSESSTMPFLTKKNISCEEIPELIGGTYNSNKVESGKILFTEGAGITMHQIMVTYEHNETWTGSIPNRGGDKFEKLYEKLESGEEIFIVFYGASTMTGANCSSKLGLEPYQESMSEGFINDLKERYPNANIKWINTALGGTTSQWGRENVTTCVQNYVPDLVFIEFGHNDACWNINVFDYIENMSFIMRATEAYNPDCAIVAIPAHMANPNSSQFSYQPDYLEPLYDEVATHEHAVVCDWTTITLDIQKRKSSFDMYVNNINHPGDWMERVLCTTLIESVLRTKDE